MMRLGIAGSRECQRKEDAGKEERERGRLRERGVRNGAKRVEMNFEEG